MTETKLKPCPFCGGEAEIRTYALWAICCTECGAQVPLPDTIMPLASDSPDMIKPWNTRVTDTNTLSAREIRKRLGWKELSEEEQEINKCENLDALERGVLIDK